MSEATSGEFRGIYVCGMSRTGTTLLCTILDAHPSISMGYELLPPHLESPAAEGRRIAEAIESGTDGKGRRVSPAATARLVKQAARCEVALEDLLEILRRLEAEGVERLDDLAGRVRLSVEIVGRKVRTKGTRFGGFKLNAPSVEAMAPLLPDGHFIFITRDPRDVLASHRAAGFDRTAEEVAAAWRNYTDRFLEFQRNSPGRTTVLRYEQLVMDPAGEIRRLAEEASVPFDESMLRFYESKASVLVAGHRNRDELGRDFFTGSIARWMSQVDDDSLQIVQDTCAESMAALGYRRHQPRKSIATPKLLKLKHSSRVERAHRFVRSDYEHLVLPFKETEVNLTWYEAACETRDRDKSILVLRHDVDHDIDTAVRMAQWEESHDLRATYCILPTAWYYGSEQGLERRRFHEMIEKVMLIQSLGHEINLHNNFVVEALLHGGCPLAMLECELAFLRREGVEVRGTSTHGDGICKPLDFRNFELFRETVYESRGGARTITHEGRSVRIGDASMREFGLEYEAYELPRDLYVTDSGGRLRCQNDTRGRGGMRRKKMDRPPVFPHITGILTHPVWWNMQETEVPDHSIEDLVKNGHLLSR